MATKQQDSFFRIRRKSDGMFFGCREWGKTHSKVGKTYAKPYHATSAFKQSDITDEAADHQLVEYVIKQGKVMEMTEVLEQ